MRIPHPQQNWGTPYPPHYAIIGWTKVGISETSDMTSEGLGDMFEGDSADICAGKFLLTSMGG